MKPQDPLAERDRARPSAEPRRWQAGCIEAWPAWSIHGKESDTTPQTRALDQGWSCRATKALEEPDASR